MNKLKIWFDSNRLSLNLGKTKIMLFGNCRMNTQLKINVEGVEIERVHEIKFLGVIIDDKISWKPHIKHVQSKVSRSIAVINKAKKVLDNKSLHTLYYSLVSPYLQYCAEVWGNNYKTSLYSLTILQKRAIRIIHKVGYQEHTNPLFLKSKLLKITDIVQYQTAQIMFKAKNKLLPGNIQQLFKNREECYNLRERCKFKEPRFRTTRKRFCLSVCGVRLLNGFSVELKQCTNMRQFKMMYKNIILKRYEDEEGVANH